MGWKRKKALVVAGSHARREGTVRDTGRHRAGALRGGHGQSQATEAHVQRAGCLTAGELAS